MEKLKSKHIFGDKPTHVEVSAPSGAGNSYEKADEYFKMNCKGLSRSWMKSKKRLWNRTHEWRESPAGPKRGLKIDNDWLFLNGSQTKKLHYDNPMFSAKICYELTPPQSFLLFKKRWWRVIFSDRKEYNFASATECTCLLSQLQVIL